MAITLFQVGGRTRWPPEAPSKQYFYGSMEEASGFYWEIFIGCKP